MAEKGSARSDNGAELTFQPEIDIRTRAA